QHVGERRACELLHHEERLAARSIPELVDRHDRWVLEPALDPRFAQESRDLFLARICKAQPLDRDLAADLLVARGEHLAHAAAAEDLADLVAADRLAAPRIGHLWMASAIGDGRRTV